LIKNHRVAALGYLGINSRDLEGWCDLATKVLGLEVGRNSTPDELRLKLDTYEHRIAVHRAGEEGLAYLGWEVPTMRQLAAVTAALEARGVEVHRWSDEQAQRRGVGRAVHLEGPDGVRLELFVGARREDTTPFRSPTDAKFVAEELGLGHIVLWATDYDATIEFYTEGLGLEITDFLVQGPFRGAFLGCNPRHHSIAIFSAAGVPFHVDHFMLEVSELWMVGQAHDRCLQGHGEIAYTLGQHWNDRSTSFYVSTPSGFNVEMSWGGIRIDRENWVSHLGNGDISYWGHHARCIDDARKLRAESWIADLRLVNQQEA
jgi:3,4-dihydroxy-9,10-secoandrosta-1,3,5(10)-triene-9,17-dione 4,5-dioxygenase